MHAVYLLIGQFITSEDGPTAAEYAVMLALIVMAALGAITGIGTKVEALFSSFDGRLPTGSAS